MATYLKYTEMFRKQLPPHTLIKQLFVGIAYLDNNPAFDSEAAAGK